MDNILIIEDSITINNIIKKELSKFDFNLDQVFTLKDAKDFLGKRRYKLIILDLHLPDGEGSELIANIQSLTKTKVIILTSTQDNNLREELFEYGILDYIIKDKNLIYSINEIAKIILSLKIKSKGKILVIDDSKFICKQIKTMLEPRNYLVKSTFNAKDGLNELAKNDFELIILDMELPDMHGIKVLELIRRNNRFISLPILVLSGTSTPQIIREVLKNGANDFLRKPFVFEEFILKVDLWINYFTQEKMLKEKTMELKLINENLQKMVFEESEKNRKKDIIMFQQSRQAQMGEMIAMIAHQWRQPLNAISAANSVIKRKSKMKVLNEAITENITSKIHTYIEYLSSTIDDFRDFFKPDKELKRTDFNIIYMKSVTIIKSSLINKNIKLIEKIDCTEKFMAYENELVHVILSIINNAQDVFIQRNTANPEITIQIENTTLTISDNGGGIPDDIIDKIFDPYFSTKSKKNGTGLGLYMSKMIVEKHSKGKFSALNTKDGAVFEIKLPKITD